EGYERRTRWRRNGRRVVRAAGVGGGGAACDLSGIPRPASVGSPAGARRLTTHSAAQRATVCSVVPEALSRLPASRAAPVSHSSAPGATLVPAAGHDTIRPPWSPRAVITAVSANPGVACSPWPLTTYSAPSSHMHQTRYAGPAPGTVNHATVAFFIASSI